MGRVIFCDTLNISIKKMYEKPQRRFLEMADSEDLTTPLPTPKNVMISRARALRVIAREAKICVKVSAVGGRRYAVGRPQRLKGGYPFSSCANAALSLANDGSDADLRVVVAATPTRASRNRSAAAS